MMPATSISLGTVIITTTSFAMLKTSTASAGTSKRIP